MRMTREGAIRSLSEAGLASLSIDQRRELLSTMQRETWDSDPAWKGLTADIQAVMSSDIELFDPSDARFDPVLMMRFALTFNGATNAYLLAQLRETSPHVQAVDGDEPKLIACPCCGLRTLSSSGDSEICRVCWWEDDGQDNTQADHVMGGPNYHLSLTQGRVNYLLHGISDPDRTDLQAIQEPADKYSGGRIFQLVDNNTRAEESDVLTPYGMESLVLCYSTVGDMALLPEQLRNALPRGKDDEERAQALKQLDLQTLAPAIPYLLVWLQDCNWPVSRPVEELLITTGVALVEPIRAVLRSQDDIWKYWVLSCLVREVPILKQHLVDDLHRLATSPSENERAEEVDRVALEILADVR